MTIPLDERLERLGRWFRRENERPLLGFYLDSAYPLHRYRGARAHLADGPVTPEDVVVSDYAADWERLHALHEKAGGDLVWSASPFFGMPWVEASLGCGVVADFNTGSTRAVPPRGFGGSKDIPAFSGSNPWVRKMLEFIPSQVAHSQGRYPVGVTLMRGVSDLLAALFGGESFIYRMMEDSAEIHAAVEKLTDYWIEFGRCLLDHVPDFHGGTGAFFYSIWTPGRCIWLQEDAAALLSPELYREFILPADARIAGAFDHTIIHLHPSRFIPVDFLVETAMDAIELHFDKGGPGAPELAPFHSKILARKPLLVFGDLSRADLDFMLGHLHWKGLAVNMTVSSVDEAADTWKYFQDRIKNRRQGT